jgi:putative CocE/NonD family hydrolase
MPKTARARCGYKALDAESGHLQRARDGRRSAADGQPVAAALSAARGLAQHVGLYRDNIELPFSTITSRKGALQLPEAYVFETGSNQWKTYDHWPPKQERVESLYVQPNKKLSFTAPANTTVNAAGYDEYISDPADPVPYTSRITIGMAREYMAEDQRFVAARPDVLVYQTDTLNEDFRVAGPIGVDLTVSTNGTDSDFVVKLIDVQPSGSDARPRRAVPRQIPQ